MSRRSFSPQLDLLIPTLAALTVGALSAFGDWVWFHFLEDGALTPAIAHGVLFFIALALVLAAASRQRGVGPRLVKTLPWLGFFLAAIFYPLARLTGYVVALVVCWVAMWIGTAALQAWARGHQEGRGAVALRGLLAAVGSGLAFWTVSGMWTTAYPDGPPLLEHFAKWSFAFWPGFLALLVAQPTASQDDA